MGSVLEHFSANCLKIFNVIKGNIFFHAINNFYVCIRNYRKQLDIRPFFFLPLLEDMMDEGLMPGTKYLKCQIAFLIDVYSYHAMYLTHQKTTHVITSAAIETATCAPADATTSAATKTAISRVEMVNFTLVLITVFFSSIFVFKTIA